MDATNTLRLYVASVDMVMIVHELRYLLLEIVYIVALLQIKEFRTLPVIHSPLREIWFSSWELFHSLCNYNIQFIVVTWVQDDNIFFLLFP